MSYQLEGNKLLYHLDRVASWNKGELTYPLYLEVGPSRACNQRCNHCYIMHLGFENVNLEREVFLKLINDASEVGVKGIQLAGCGEPLINKATPDAIRLAHSKGIAIALTTNGMLLSKDVADSVIPYTEWTRVSFLGTDPKSYSFHHKVDEVWFERVLQNLQYAASVKSKDTTLGMALYVFPENGSNIVEFVKRVRDIGLDYIQIKCSGYDHRNTYSPPRGLAEEFADQLKEAECLSTQSFKVQVRWDQFALGEMESKGEIMFELPEGCLSLDFMAVVDSDGSVISCNGHWREEDYTYGNLNENSFKEIWESDRRISITKRMNKHVEHSECYSPCRNYSCNKLLWDLKNPPEHVNLI